MNIYFTFFEEGTTRTSFTLKHKVQTGVWALTYRVIVLDAAFPDHLNLLSNVNVFGSSTITSSTTRSATLSYSSIASGYPFTSFTPVNGSDYSYNKVVTFLSCFDFQAHAGTTPHMTLTYTILNSNSIRFDMAVGSVVDIDKVHWNMIIMDLAQLQNSGKYNVYFGSSVFTSALGGQIPILQPYESTVMMGWTDFTALS